MTDTEKATLNAQLTRLEGYIREGELDSASFELLNLGTIYLSGVEINSLKSRLSSIVSLKQRSDEDIPLPDSDKSFWNCIASCVVCLFFAMPSICMLWFFKPLPIWLAYIFAGIFALSFAVFGFSLFSALRVAPEARRDVAKYKDEVAEQARLWEQYIDERIALADDVHRLRVE